MTPTTAMVLAAGLGSRMRPLTDDRPKALVEVAGRPLIDHMLDRLAEAGVTRAVVNVHAHADRLEAHLANRTTAPSITISDERDLLRETGGGLKHARSLLGPAPIFTVNIDAVWIEDGKPALSILSEAFDAERMDACLLATPTATALGFDGPGDLFLSAAGQVRFRGDAASAPYVFAGIQIFNPRMLDAEAGEVFSTSRIWRRLAEGGRLGGAVLTGPWMHVGDPRARDAAERTLRAEALASTARRGRP